MDQQTCTTTTTATKSNSTSNTSNCSLLNNSSTCSSCSNTHCSPLVTDVREAMVSLSLQILISRVSQTQERIKHITQVVNEIVDKGLPLCIEVCGVAKESSTNVTMETKPITTCHYDNGVNDGRLLIEKWIIQTVSLASYCGSKNNVTSTTSIPFLLQAVKSFLYFSQIYSWCVSNDGVLPFNLVYSVYACLDVPIKSRWAKEYIPEIHHFPVAPVLSKDGIEVTVKHLPRLTQIPSCLIQLCLEKNSTISAPLEHTVSTSGSHNKRTTVSQVKGSVSESEVHKSFKNLTLQTCPSRGCANFPFSPPIPSPLSYKIMPILSSDNKGTLHQSEQGHAGSSGFRARGTSDGLCNSSCSNEAIISPCSSQKKSLADVCDSNLTRHSEYIPKQSSSRLIVTKFNKSDFVESSTVTNNSNNGIGLVDADISKSNTVRPPALSSPTPFSFRKKSANGRENKDTYKKLKRRSCGVFSKSNSNPVPAPVPIRSMSLPVVVPNLCLLGTYEESVLNGRIDPLGYVEGFTAQLGASGSFCPEQVSLPVTASFFSLHDDRGTSPYLGHIDLSSIKKRGYRVPRRGTIQVTLFNPNKMVVKIYVVIYDHTDMPPNTTTFIRQKTLSRSSSFASDGHAILPALQYLIHLRFLCTKSSKVYLHTDIKLLFARRAPDTDPDLSKVSLYTVTEGPSQPKYGPLNRELC